MKKFLAITFDRYDANDSTVEHIEAETIEEAMEHLEEFWGDEYQINEMTGIASIDGEESSLLVVPA